MLFFFKGIDFHNSFFAFLILFSSLKNDTTKILIPSLIPQCFTTSFYISWNCNLIKYLASVKRKIRKFGWSARGFYVVKVREINRRKFIVWIHNLMIIVCDIVGKRAINLFRRVNNYGAAKLKKEKWIWLSCLFLFLKHFININPITHQSNF